MASAIPAFIRPCWYEREFELTQDNLHREKRVFLHFGAVDYHARVWVNGIKVAEHEGGHTPFSADITFALRAEGPQRVTVWAHDDPHDLEKPRGKQDWKLEPHGIWYPRTTGIWQSVWLEYVPRTYVATLRWTPSVDRWEIALSATIGGDSAENLRLAVHLSSKGRRSCG